MARPTRAANSLGEKPHLGIDLASVASQIAARRSQLLDAQLIRSCCVSSAPPRALLRLRTDCAQLRPQLIRL